MQTAVCLRWCPPPTGSKSLPDMLPARKPSSGTATHPSDFFLTKESTQDLHGAGMHKRNRLRKQTLFLQGSWVVLCRQIEASLHLLDISMDGNTVRVEGARPDERVISDNVLEDVQKAHPVSMPQAASLHSCPPVCEDTIERQEADALAARLVYKDAEVMVELVVQADFKPDTLNLTGQPMVGLLMCVPI